MYRIADIKPTIFHLPLRSRAMFSSQSFYKQFVFRTCVWIKGAFQDACRRLELKKSTFGPSGVINIRTPIKSFGAGVRFHPLFKSKYALSASSSDLKFISFFYFFPNQRLCINLHLEYGVTSTIIQATRHLTNTVFFFLWNIVYYL